MGRTHKEHKKEKLKWLRVLRTPKWVRTLRQPLHTNTRDQPQKRFKIYLQTNYGGIDWLID